MHGYDPTTYGEAFADVYDEWYGDISDVGATVRALAEFVERAATSRSGDSRSHGALPIVELGVGTGRIAIPLAAHLSACEVWGIDASPAMIARLAAKEPPPNLHSITADMVEGLRQVCPGRDLALVFVAFNTFFNLDSRARQIECMRVAASRLSRSGHLVIEAFVPGDQTAAGDQIDVKAMQTDRVVLSIARFDGNQRIEGQYVEITETSGIRLRPWSICYAAPAELDDMAATAGLTLVQRSENFDAAPFTDHSERHVSVYVPT